MTSDLSSPDGAVAFVEKHGVGIESGQGPVPSLADAVAGGPIKGSWWGHPRGREIFRATRAVRDSDTILVCRLIDRKITYVHRRLWSALARLSGKIERSRLDAIREEHTASGAHRLVTTLFPDWIPAEIRKAAEKLSDADACERIGAWLVLEPGPAPKRR
jgi:hypothetical protein